MAQNSDGRAGWGIGGWPIRVKIVVAMLLLALVPLVISGGLVFQRTEEVVLRQVATDSEAVARERARQLGDEVERLRSLGRTVVIAQTTTLLGAELNQRETFLLSARAGTGAVQRLALIDPNGRVLVAAPRLGESLNVRLPEGATAPQGTTVVQRGDDGQTHLILYLPIVQRGEVRMVLQVTGILDAMLGEAGVARADAGAFLAVTDKDGALVHVTSRAMLDAARGVSLAGEPTVSAALRGLTTSGWSQGALGGVHLAAAPVTGTDWTLVYALPSAAALGSVTDLRAALSRDLLGLTGVLMLVVLVLAMLLSRQFVLPILRVCGVMGRVRDGDTTARVAVVGRDELGTLARDLNQTLDALVALVQTRAERDELQRDIRVLLDEVSDVAAGDLTVEAQVTANQTGAIADAFNYMIEELRGLVRRSQTTADEISRSAARVTGLTDQMAESAEAQARRLGEAREVVTTMTGLMGDVRAAVGDSVAAAGEARLAVDAGQQAVAETTGAMSRLRTEARETAKKIKRLGESSQEIGEIVRLINEIADQTHLLALNASIQAAMAGEHGRGFAVVAEEVRALAERSATATERIDELIRVIQTDSNAAVVAMERSTQEVVAGSRLADRAGGALQAIGAVTERIVLLSGEIEALVQRQVESATTLAGTVGMVAGATTQASEEARAVAAGMQALREMSVDLRDSVSVFKVDAESAGAESADEPAVAA